MQYPSLSIKNLAKTTIALTLATTSSIVSAYKYDNAVEPGFFIGGDISTSLYGQRKATLTLGSNEDESEADLDTNTLALHAGYRYDTDNRILLSRSYVNGDLEGSDVDFTGWDLDWHFVYHVDGLKPFWGIGFGLYNYENTNKYVTNDSDIGGFAFNLLAGIKHQYKDFEFDISYRIKGIGWQTLKDNTTGAELQLSDSTNSINIGAAYIF